MAFNVDRSGPVGICRGGRDRIPIADCSSSITLKGHLMLQIVSLPLDTAKVLLQLQKKDTNPKYRCENMAFIACAHSLCYPDGMALNPACWLVVQRAGWNMLDRGTGRRHRCSLERSWSRSAETSHLWWSEDRSLRSR